MKWLATVLVLCACPGPGPCPTELVLGTETDGRDFTALTDGADLKINRGPQGGWHVWVSGVRVRFEAPLTRDLLDFLG